MPAPTYIISKVADPIFAVFIGLSAAATRINREEKEKGRTTSETFNAGLRHVISIEESGFPGENPKFLNATLERSSHGGVSISHDITLSYEVSPASCLTIYYKTVS
ncbi:hypothetical protein VM1G_11498 [Cytospora mali]|uniref:Uncharacterized protein n=1 Tax=Cytospora mali TaxID=578113 RepID=A0A194VTC5_CYTMA|nr:hypothetical protein VM1G_11498 [Valsa mali]